MAREFTGTMGQSPRRNTETQVIENILYAELLMRYDSQLQGITDFRVRILEKRDDRDTLHMLHDGALPMPINHRLPTGVLYLKACFGADPSKQIELLIGRFKTIPGLCALGMHDGQQWIYVPRSLQPGMRREI